jgi:hypothetical protein
MLAGKFVMLVALKERRLRRQQGAHLLEQAGAVGWVHGYELNGHSVSVSDATHNGAATHLPDGKIQKNLHQATHRNAFLGANEQAADAKAIDERNAAFRASLPSRNNGFRRLYARVTPLIRSVHQGAFPR